MELLKYRQKITFPFLDDLTSFKLWDTKTLQCLNIYDVGRPLNAASMSPLMDHVIMGGGERAEDVTQTGATSDQFKVCLLFLTFVGLFVLTKNVCSPQASQNYKPTHFIGRYVCGIENIY